MEEQQKVQFSGNSTKPSLLFGFRSLFPNPRCPPEPLRRRLQALAEFILAAAAAAPSEASPLAAQNRYGANAVAPLPQRATRPVSLIRPRRRRRRLRTEQQRGLAVARRHLDLLIESDEWMMGAS
uniref:Uncharacterized protein n=1 Tax=Oryza glumipatula TaxID=40148 RepID=A0A0D9Y815_9ORYZ